MKVIIIGLGKVGTNLIEQLNKEGHDICVIDNDFETLEEINNTLDVLCVHGNGVDMDVQLEAGVKEADLVIATTPTDDLNLISCLLAKKHGAKKVVARVRNPEYYNQIYFIQKDMGIDYIINPEFQTSIEIARQFRFPSAMNIETFCKGRVEMVEFLLKDDSKLAGMRLSEIYQSFKIKLLICVVQRGEEVFIPRGDFLLQGGDRIHITATHQEIANFAKRLNIIDEIVKNVLIIGGGRLTYYLAMQLLKMKMRVKIIEMDEKRCEDLSELLPEATIILGDGTNEELLHEENLNMADAFVTLTGLDEENIILSLYAKSQGVPKIVTKVNQHTYKNMVGGLGLETVISPKDVITNHILTYARGLENSTGSTDIESLYLLVKNRVEAVEFIVHDDLPFLNVPFKDLRIKPNVLVASLVRGGQVIIPDGNSSIQKGDKVIIVSLEAGLIDLSEILE